MPIKIHWALGKIKRAYVPLKRTFNILSQKLKNNADKKTILQIIIKILNDTVGRNGLIPILLIFGTYPKINENFALLIIIAQRAMAILKIKKTLAKHYAENTINRAFNIKNGLRA